MTNSKNEHYKMFCKDFEKRAGEALLYYIPKWKWSTDLLDAFRESSDLYPEGAKIYTEEKEKIDNELNNPVVLYPDPHGR